MSAARIRTLPAALAAALTLSAAPGGLAGQDRALRPAEPPPVVRFRLGEPSPSPFQDSVAIPFVLGEGPEPGWRSSVTAPPDDRADAEARSAGEGTARVSIRVYNLLHQGVAWATAGRPDPRAGRPVRDMEFSVPGSYTAVWDGRDADGRDAVSGPYFVEIVVDGWTSVRKVLLTR